MSRYGMTSLRKRIPGSDGRERFRRTRSVIIGLVCLNLGVIFAPQIATAVEKATDVFVTNTDSNPVPTKQVGTADVNVANTPSVRVAGTPSVSLAGTPVQFHFTFRFEGLRSDSSDPYTVPDGKRLRIDFVTFHDLNRDAVVERLSFGIPGPDGNAIHHYIATSAQGSNGEVASEPVHAYVEAGKNVHFSLALDRALGSDSTFFFMHGSFTGVLLDA